MDAVQEGRPDTVRMTAVHGECELITLERKLAGLLQPCDLIQTLSQMLVLSREVDQSIVITVDRPGTIVLTCRSVRGRRVTLGLDAPADIHIWREELAKKDAAKVA